MKDEILDYNWVIAHKIDLPLENGILFTQCMDLEILIGTCKPLKEHDIRYQIIESEEGLPGTSNSIYEIHIEKDQLARAVDILNRIAMDDSKLVSNNQDPIKSNINVEANFWLLIIFLFIVTYFLIFGSQ